MRKESSAYGDAQGVSDLGAMTAKGRCEVMDAHAV
jgi:hypothetical protein